MNKKVILRCQLLFWLLLISIFGLLLSFLPPFNNSLAFLIVLPGFLFIYFVSGYYGKIIEKEFYLRSVENAAQKHISPLSVSPAIISIENWEANDEGREKANIFIQNFIGNDVTRSGDIITGELTILRNTRFLEKCEQAGKRGAKIKLFYGLSGFKELSKDEFQKIVGEIMQNKAKIEDLYTKGYLQLNKLKGRIQYHFSVFDRKYIYIQEEHKYGHPKKSWWIGNVPFFFRRRYRCNVTALERKTISHPSPQELFEELSKIII